MVLTLRVVGVVSALAMLPALGCSTANEEPTAQTLNDVGGSMALDGDVPADAACRDLPQGCTQRPTAEQAAAIESGVAAVYPGVPAGKAADWAVSVCSDIVAGKPDSTVARNVQLRFSGGGRPDPTQAQAEQIVVIIESAGFCSAN
jgi:hypothetical protein